MALAADIVLNRISPEMPLDYILAARALNNLHQKYSVPLRVEIPNEPVQGSWRRIPMQHLIDTINVMLVDNFRALHDRGDLQPLLAPRRIIFWRAVQGFFDSTVVGALSQTYKRTISDPNLSGDELDKTKTYYYRLIVDELHRYLNSELPGRLTEEERVFLSSSLIL